MKHNEIHRLAEMATVTIGKVDRAEHGGPGVSEATRNKVLRIAKKLDYSPHPAARLLSGGASFKIGVCIPREIHFFYDEMRAGIFDEARRASGFGLELLYTPVRALGKGESGAASDLLDCGVSGLGLTPGDPDSATPLIDRSQARNGVVVCSTTDAPKDHRF